MTWSAAAFFQFIVHFIECVCLCGWCWMEQMDSILFWRGGECCEFSVAIITYLIEYVMKWESMKIWWSFNGVLNLSIYISINISIWLKPEGIQRERERLFIRVRWKLLIFYLLGERWWRENDLFFFAYFKRKKIMANVWLCSSFVSLYSFFLFVF